MSPTSQFTAVASGPKPRSGLGDCSLRQIKDGEVSVAARDQVVCQRRSPAADVDDRCGGRETRSLDELQRMAEVGQVPTEFLRMLLPVDGLPVFLRAHERSIRGARPASQPWQGARPRASSRPWRPLGLPPKGRRAQTTLALACYNLLRSQLPNASSRVLSCPLKGHRPSEDKSLGRLGYRSEAISLTGPALKNMASGFADPRLTTWLCRRHCLAAQRVIPHSVTARQAKRVR